MIPGHAKNTTYRTLALETYGVLMCASSEGCRKKLGWRAHQYGRVDRIGYIHWKQADARASRRGMRNMMKMMALVLNRSYEEEPRWKRIYLTNVWATKQIRLKYHYQVKASWSLTDRKEALRLARRAGPAKTGSLRWKHRGFYKWLLDAGLVGAKAVPFPSQVGDPSEVA